MLNVLTKKSEDKRKKKGFTLVELIIVIAIIAILAAVALPKFLDVTKDANEKADLANAKTIESTVTILIANNELDLSKKITKAPLPLKPSAAPADGTKEDPHNRIARALQSVPTSKKDKGKLFEVEIETDGTIEVYVGDSEDDLLH